jgi:chitinase
VSILIGSKHLPFSCVGTSTNEVLFRYPGAPDRGGKPEDTKNFVLLLQAIRQRFEAQATVSGHTWGLSFTAPTSYWYMRWFDLSGLMKEVDWMNLMTYDM